MLVTVFALVLMLTASAEFAKTNTYTDGQFTDVKGTSWYANEVKSAYELGFMNGMTATSFEPSGNVTVAQGITMTARIHAINLGTEVPANTEGAWYNSAVKYAISNGLFADGDFDSYTRPIKRYEMATLVYSTMPTDAFEKRNTVYSIPDVSNAADYKNKLLTLYNAGIVMGSDDYGSFKPESNITRAECSAIINRVAIPENRLTKTLETKQTRDAYILCNNKTYQGNKEGVSSGWVYDNRGAEPRMKIEGNYGMLADVSDKYGTALIREFNPIYTGTIVTETSIKVNGNGVSLEYRDVNDDVLYCLKTADNAWNIVEGGGYNTPIMPNAISNGTEKEFKLRIYINLDNGTATTYINNVNCGESSLLSDSLLNFRFATDEKSKVTATPGAINMVANYAADDDFDIFGTEAVYGWTATGASVTNGELVLGANASAKKTFDKTSGKVSAQTYFLVNGNDASYTLFDGANTAVAVSVVNGKLYVNGAEMYTCTQNMWYRLRVDIDTAAQTAGIWLNGRTIGIVTLSSVTGIDGYEYKAGADTTVKLDNALVYNTYDHADYVPKPAAKASLDDYVVGMNICSLWKNGEHSGWACISPYDEPTPVLGYYDEGNIESADWEIKYMVEHGIDFQAFCWFNDQKDVPTKMPAYASQLHEGYMYSRYSDYMKYTLIWEASNGVKFNSDYFRNYLIPYWFENYFLDERYLKLDNQIILCIFGADELPKASYFGSVENAKAELDYLDEVAKSYGFDGVIIMSGNGDSNTAAQMGMEAKYAYGWGTEGKKFTYNRDSILKSAENKSLYTVPTISTGFDSIPWHGIRYGNMPVGEYRQTADFVKNEYLPKYATPGTWQEKLVMLSNWNEYGEGTYVMPSGLNGFGYLDVLRNSFTNLGTDHADLVPTANQSERFNHLYPQYARLLRDDGWFDKNKKGVGSLYINEQLVNSVVVSENSSSGILFPFDAGEGIGYLMNVHFTWRKDLGTLKVEGNGHTVEYLVGSSKYTVDGTQKDLGYTLYLSSGLPMLSFKTLSEALEFAYEEKDGNAYVKTEQYDSYTQIGEREFGEWNFNGFDTEGWTSTNMKLTVTGGSMKAESKTADHFDPIISNTSFDAFPAEMFKGIEYRVKYDYTTKSGNPHYMVLFFTTDTVTNFGPNTIYTALETLSSDGEYRTFYVDLTTENMKKIWKDNITGLRFDPFDGNGTMEIDYIKFIPNPDYVYVDPATLPFEIKNGDAEDTNNVAFFNPAGKVEIVEDPRNASNHVYKVTGNPGKSYGHFRQSVVFKQNHKYEYSMDICYLGNNAGIDTGKNGTMMVNFAYPDSDGKTDHAINFTTINKGEWVTVTGTYIPTSITSDKGHIFAPFVNPEGDYGSVFLVDNIVVNEIPPMKALSDSKTLDGKIPYSNTAKDVSYSEKDNAYVLTGTDDKKSWTYFLVDTRFVSGAEYNISFEVKLLSDKATSVCPNLRYTGNDGKYDHVLSSVSLTPNGDWVKVKAKHIVGGLSSEQQQNMFSVYANPIGDTGASFMIRNIVVDAGDIDPSLLVEEEKKEEIKAFDFGELTEKPLEDAGILTGVVPTSNTAQEWGYSEKEGAYVFVGANKKSWTYFLADAEFENGKTYTISYEIKLLADASGNTNVQTAFCPNLRYSSKDDKYDHVVTSKSVSSKDEWVTCEYKYTVQNMANEQKQNMFTIYANPQNDLGMTFMIKNISVTEN